MNPTSIPKDTGSILDLTQWVKDPSGVAMSCDVGHRWASDPLELPAAAVPIPPLPWELPYASDVALKKDERKKKRFTNSSSQWIFLCVVIC